MKKRKSLFILLILFVVCLIGNVNAAEYTVKMVSTSESKLVAGDTVVIDFKISEITAGDGIDAIVATIDYDKNIFEEITEDNLEGINKWSVGIYNTEKQNFTLLKSSKINLPSDVLRITFRVKDGISVDSTIVTLKDITCSGGIETGDIEVQEVKINIDKKEEPSQPNKNEIANEVVNEIASGNTNVNKINTNKTNNDVSTGKLPQTGEGIEIAVGITLISIIAIIAYAKYRNINI